MSKRVTRSPDLGVVLYVGHSGAFNAQKGTPAAKNALKRKKTICNEEVTTRKMQKVTIEGMPSAIKVLKYQVGLSKIDSVF